MTTQNSAMGDEAVRICAYCGHFEGSHKWYAQDEENWQGEERWECRFDLCQCIVTWSDHNFVDVSEALKSRDQQMALAARIDELEREDEAERELFRNGKNPDTSGYRNDRLEELKKAQNKEK